MEEAARTGPLEVTKEKKRLMVGSQIFRPLLQLPTLLSQMVNDPFAGL